MALIKSGALVDDLSVGDVVTASDLLGLDSAGPLPLPGARPVVMATVPRVVDRPKARASLSSRGAEVCEMEAAGVFEAAAGRPFHAIKVVSDLAGAKPPRLRGLPRPVRKPFFDLLTYRLMDRQLTPVIEAWLRSERT